MHQPIILPNLNLPINGGVPHMIPVQKTGQSVYFSVSGTYVTRANLIASGTLLSTISPDYSKFDQNIDPAPHIELNFLGSNLHTGLISGDINVVIYGKDTPSLGIHDQPGPTWATVGGDHYKEIVTAGSETGPKKLELIYLPDRLGFKKL